LLLKSFSIGSPVLNPIKSMTLWLRSHSQRLTVLRGSCGKNTTIVVFLPQLLYYARVRRAIAFRKKVW